MNEIDISMLKKNMNGGNKNYDNKPLSRPKNNSYGGSNRNNNGNNRGNFNSNNNASTAYIGSPYNFVPFYDKVVSVDEDSMKVHHIISDELLSGEIGYTITADTPLFISDGNKDNPQFVKNETGETIIPGSTMRGLIRNNVQILGLSSFDDDIDDYNLMYRNVANGAEQKRYNKVLGSNQVSLGIGQPPVSVLTNVSAGYIAKVGDKYLIYKTEVDSITPKLNAMNYYVLSERNVANDMKVGKTTFPYFKEHPNHLQHYVEKGFRKDFDKRGRTIYVGEANKSYCPGYHQVSYEIHNLKNVSAVGEPNVFSKNGYLVGTGAMQNKKAQYIVPAIDKSKTPIEISARDIDAFKIDYKKKENTLKGDKLFFNLPKEDEIKPVFYIELSGRLYFGFTPRLRLFYDKSIKAGLHQLKTKFDFSKSIFGVSNEKSSYRSKVSFCDAKLVVGKNDDKVSVILSEPKPTSYLDYIEQEQINTTYNSDDFRLRGVKQYWLHDSVVKVVIDEKQKKVATVMHPLKENTKFSGTIRFNNLTETELGLLLWSIKLNKDSKMNIGMGKPYGYGVITVSDVRLRLFDNNKAYDLTGNLVLDPFVSADVDKYITQYKADISKRINGKNVDDLPHIKEFFCMKDSTNIPKNEKTRYMSIDKKEYQSRKQPLPAASEVIKK